ncbi:MAG: YggS family pyridoxal phosphate-dependent enzyme [Pseudomonadota bacterium]|nr:YggS family pyridoxal phosphate-dependent enzyme [Pseudomonadota bacterium]MDE3036983.1 YggS family pyridoxal phosphate-dependent enzyme [Pseudomonadota bacterium]
MSVVSSCAALRKSIEKSRKNSLFTVSQVTLLAAVKGQPVSSIMEAIDAGVADFGENRVQEAGAKWPALKARHPNVRLHLIGALQTNKAAEALALFDVIQTIDRPKLAETIARIRDSGFGIQEKQFYIQVNTGEEPQKAGVVPKEADTLIAQCRALRLPIVGLMCVPPAGRPAAPHFALLRQIAERHGLKELSMGMSEDFETAVRMGSTCVRVGRALFGIDPAAR